MISLPCFTISSTAYVLMSIERAFALIYVLPIILVCSIAAIKKHPDMITLAHKSCVTMLVFPLDTLRIATGNIDVKV